MQVAPGSGSSEVRKGWVGRSGSRVREHRYPRAGDHPTSTGPGLSWPIRVAVAALMVFVLGHVLFIVVVSYQLTHWDAVTAPSRATYALDDHGAGMAAMWFMLVGALVVSALVILVLGVLLTSMLRGSRTAWRGICVLLCCYLVLCGIPLTGFTGQGDRIDRPDNVLEITYGPATPAWVPPADAGKTYLIIGGGVLTVTALLLPAAYRVWRATRPFGDRRGVPADGHQPGI